MVNVFKWNQREDKMSSSSYGTWTSHWDYEVHERYVNLPVPINEHVIFSNVLHNSPRWQMKDIGQFFSSKLHDKTRQDLFLHSDGIF